MSNNFLKNTIKTLEKLSREPMTYTMEILPDENGYLDKECPNEECLSKFKVQDEDWANLVPDEKVFCPFCGFSAPSDQWFTTEQVEQAHRQAKEAISAQIMQALDKDAKDFNRHQPRKSFIKMSMKVKGKKHFFNYPAQALDIMTQDIKCENCGCRYQVIGSAFFCPCCGENSAERTYEALISKIRSAVSTSEIIDKLISDKDEAANNKAVFLESSLRELVTTVQRTCELSYGKNYPDKTIKRNVFQRLDDGNNLWVEATGEGYNDWLNDDEYSILRICFQRRHILEHNAGIVDKQYLDKCDDTSYREGQRIVLKADEIYQYIDVVEKLCKKVISIKEDKELV